MEVQIISRESIKPCSPTPDHSRTYNLCYFDQIASRVYTQSLLFYSATPTHENPPHIVSHRLKNSLSKTLTRYYPFAGRIKDGITIDCNDEGATFVEAKVTCDMAFVLRNSEDVEILQQLSPCPPHVPGPKPDQELIVVQLNYFGCGGLAICACISHVIADASAAANFLKSWAAVARDDHDQIERNVIYDCSSLFPTRDLSMFYRVMTALHAKTHVESPHKVIQKSFVFDGSKIAALREEIGDALYRPSRIEAVMGLLWEALIDATAAGVSPIRALSNTVNLRSRMNPPLPQTQCIGNVFALALATAPMGETLNRTSLSTKIHKSIKQFDDGFIRKMFTETCGESFDEHLLRKIEEFGNDSKFGIFFFTSCYRIPFYETDFGWGRPTWFGSAANAYRIGYVSDASDGEGIEARIPLSEQEMLKFQRHPAILAYATFSPTI